MLEFLNYPFMIRAIAAGSAVALVLGYLGTFIVTRRLSFIGDGLAHASLLGVALAILLGFAPLPTAMLTAVVLAILIYYLERRTNLSGDMAIAIIFTSGMALGLILLHFYSGYQPELMSYLFGNILAISRWDLISIISASVIIITFLTIFFRRFLFATFDPVGAYLAGKKPWLYDLLLYIMTAVAIIAGIKLVGIILVSALLVIPSAISRLYTKSFVNFILLTILLSFLIINSGLILSYYLDLPSGATIVLTGSILFMFLSITKKLIK
ncbi:MAG: metal ABC transporter permease [Patescibacteria group bacterium]|jgi:zinc transport system permease protein|nr:metal ABC transporter permease [Patescibacteria group bacterium]MDD3778348.1 metal ABC transporter permease [Patescibacteria group bacterium]MDD3939707.1 metal ABC transporter permease [Patescibacteria group bacterium]MDD4444088.1 metal ABC transporter permease [Patescibacteria group bacterium]NCU39839.1 metal ABC transporter permease [Candidatus Falkowbacteria bacterium]